MIYKNIAIILTDKYKANNTYIFTNILVSSSIFLCCGWGILKHYAVKQ